MRGDSFHFIGIERNETTEGGGEHVKVVDGDAGSGATAIVPLTVGLLLPAVQKAREADDAPTPFDTFDDFFFG